MVRRFVRTLRGIAGISALAIASTGASDGDEEPAGDGHCVLRVLAPPQAVLAFESRRVRAGADSVQPAVPGSTDASHAQERRAIPPGEGCISGRVTDDTERALANTNVTLPALGRGVVADAEGRFLIDAVPTGAHHVRAMIISHADVQGEIDVWPDVCTELEVVLIRTEAWEIGMYEIPCIAIGGSWTRVSSGTGDRTRDEPSARLDVCGSRVDVPGDCNSLSGEHRAETDSTGSLTISGTKRHCPGRPDPGEIFRGHWTYVCRDSVLILTSDRGSRLILMR
jgi:hypothetical protein